MYNATLIICIIKPIPNRIKLIIVKALIAHFLSPTMDSIENTNPTTKQGILDIANTENDCKKYRIADTKPTIDKPLPLQSATDKS